MKNCILCKRLLSNNESPEHILLNALGGRKKTRDVLCSDCNNVMGAGPDKDLAESVAPLRTIANLKSGSNQKAPSLYVNPPIGEPYTLHPDGQPNLSIKKAINFGKDDDGNTILSVDATNESQFKHLLKQAAKALKLPDENHEAFIKNALDEATISRVPAGKFQDQLKFGEGRSQEAMAKACLVLWAELVGNNEVCSEEYDRVRAFIRHSEKPSSDAFTFGTDTRELPKLPQEFGKTPNLIWVGSNHKGTVRGYFRLYGAVGWTFTLCEKSNYTNMSIILISNPFDQSKWVCDEKHANILSFDWVGSRPPYRDINWEKPTTKINLIMAHGQKNMLDQAFKKIVEETFQELEIDKKELRIDKSLPVDKTASFAKLLSKKFAYLVVREPYDEPFRNRDQCDPNPDGDNQ